MFSVQRIVYIQVVLRNAANIEAIRAIVEGKIVEFANRGYRALGLSRAEGIGSAGKPYTFLTDPLHRLYPVCIIMHAVHGFGFFRTPGPEPGH